MKFLKNLLYPHDDNNYKAKILQPSGLFFVKLGLVASQLVLQFAIIGPFPKVLGYAAQINTDEVIRLTNEKRKANGQAPVVKNDLLSAAAAEKGKYMIDHDFWAHVAPDGTEPWFFFQKAGYKYRFAGENLARDFTNADSAVEAWMASPSHKENMLSDRYSDIGVAVVEGDLAGADTTIVVQLFGKKFIDTVPEPLADSGGGLSLATPVPTSTPEPIVIVAGATSTPTQVSPFMATKGFSIVVVGLLLAILVVDEIVTTRKKIKRISGRVFAHIAYLSMIMIIVLLLKAGKII